MKLKNALTQNINLQLSSQELELIDRAAECSGMTRHGFIVAAALEEARKVLMAAKAAHQRPVTGQDLVAALEASPLGDVTFGRKSLK